MSGIALRLFANLQHLVTGGTELPIITGIGSYANNYSIANNNLWFELDPINLKVSVTLDVVRMCLVIWTGSLFFTSAGTEIDLDIAIDGVRVGDATNGLYRASTNTALAAYPFSLAYAKSLAAGVHTFSPFAKGASASGIIQGLDSGFGAGKNQVIVLCWA